MARKPSASTITAAGNKPKKVNWQPTMAAAGRLKSQQIVGNRQQSGKSRQKSSMQSSNSESYPQIYMPVSKMNTQVHVLITSYTAVSR